MPRWIVPCLVTGLLCLSCGGTQAAPTTAPATFTGIDGITYEPLKVAPHKAAVLIFILQDCPICNSYAPQIERLNSQFAARNVAFYAVHVDPALSIDEARKHAKEYGYELPVLVDRNHELVSRLGVVTAPTAVVLGPDGATKYKGRIDDRYAALGKPRTVATTHELQDALSAVLDDKPVATPQSRSIGCAVPDLPSKAP